MIAADTNILFRFLLRDDPRQHSAARSLFDSSSVYIPITVVLETEWVLRHSYRFSRAEVGDAFVRVLGLPNAEFGERAALERALEFVQGGLDFADALHLALSHSALRFVTFDAKFAKRSEGLGPCPVTLLKP